MRKLMFLCLIGCLLLCAMPTIGMAQTGNTSNQLSPANPFAIDVRNLSETKWRYTYTLHVESNTIVHKADKEYRYFLYLKYDNTLHQSLHDVLTESTWQLSDNRLTYMYNSVSEFTVRELTKKILALEFANPTGTGTYRYYYTRIESKDAPFERGKYELPEVLVETTAPIKERKHWWWLFGLNQEKPNQEPTYIHIELSGGGYYGGIDPVLRDFVRIKPDGRLVHEFKSVQQGLIVQKRTVSRIELEQFAEYIVSQGFFELERMYDCKSGLCQQRKKQKPTPLPLTLMVAYGNRKKVVTVAIYGEDERRTKYVDYPAAIDNIVNVIYKMSNEKSKKTGATLAKNAP